MWNLSENKYTVFDTVRRDNFMLEIQKKIWTSEPRFSSTMSI